VSPSESAACSLAVSAHCGRCRGRAWMLAGKRVVVFRRLGLSHFAHHLISSTAATNNSHLDNSHATHILRHARYWSSAPRRIQFARTMASLTEEKHEWNAVRVRETFLDYFKERGHTFGRSRAWNFAWCIPSNIPLSQCHRLRWSRSQTPHYFSPMRA
jgi:hypothetical protein